MDSACGGDPNATGRARRVSHGPESQAAALRTTEPQRAGHVGLEYTPRGSSEYTPRGSRVASGGAHVLAKAT
eukprot:6054780-Prymnesium_polylepis.1